MDKIQGVYRIKNLINNKIYIGSSHDIYHRWYVHKYRLLNNKHHSPYLQASWDKYGSENFIFEIIEYASKEQQLIVVEQKWIDDTKCYERQNGYNVSRFAGSRFGVPQTEQTKIKISIATTKEKHPLWGKNLSSEHKIKISCSNKGKIAWNKNRPVSLEEKERLRQIRALQVIKPRSQETKNKISRSLMGHAVSDETKEKLRIANAGKKLSDETKEKIRQKHRQNLSCAKLTPEQVEKIKELSYNKTYTQKQIALLFNVSQSTISAIKNNKLWRT
jgi:group I intron endonuclease